MLEKRLVLFGSELYWLACRTKSEGNVTMEKKIFKLSTNTYGIHEFYYNKCTDVVFRTRCAQFRVAEPLLSACDSLKHSSSAVCTYFQLWRFLILKLASLIFTCESNTKPSHLDFEIYSFIGWQEVEYELIVCNASAKMHVSSLHILELYVIRRCTYLCPNQQCTACQWRIVCSQQLECKFCHSSLLQIWVN